MKFEERFRLSSKGAQQRLRTKALKGRFGIVEMVIDALERWLPTYRGPDGDHEGIALLCGVELPQLTVFTTAIFPEADTRAGYVRCSEQQFATASAAARRIGLGVLAQVHTHPGGSSLHSLGDDDMVRPRYDGMLSIVVPHYGQRGLRPLESNGVHQFQDGEWVLVERESLRQGMFIIPGSIDLR
jgi:proteasome lid subunit RPN8/RPN11